MKTLLPAAGLAAAAAAALVATSAVGHADPPRAGQRIGQQRSPRAAPPRVGPQRAPRAAPQRVAPQRIIAPPSDLDDAPRRCPEALRGVALVLRPVVGGVALDFTSPRQQQVPELREQLREAALFVEMYSKAPDRWIDDPSQGRLPPLDISVNDVGTGARVLIRAERARDLPELLELARTLEILWQRSDCNEDLRVRGRIPLPSVRA